MDRPVPRLFKGMRDITASDLLLKREMIEQIRTVYERYGFSPLETPAIEYTDALGKFMPDEGLPEGGVFSLRNPDYDGPAGNPNEWLSLRYDLTAPLARVVAQYVELPAPFKRYQLGTVWRNEKPGPGRFREFTQFDFDTVGTPSMAADAEVCTVVCDALEAIGIKVGEYQVIVNDRKVLQGVLECCGLAALDITDPASQAGIALRAIDKLDRIGIAGVVQLLGKGRRDESGDFAEGAKLSEEQIALVKAFLEAGRPTRKETCDELERVVKGSGVGIRSEERRVGKEGRSGGSADH